MSGRTDDRPIVRITIAAVLGLNVLVFGVLALAGVPLIHLGSGDSGSSTDDGARYIPLADGSTVPAASVVRGVLTGKIDGAKAAGALWASPGTPFDEACPDGDDPTPVVAYARPFSTSGRTVSVRLAAYGAGQGAAALDSLVDRIDSCRSTGATGASIGPTSTAVAAWAQTSNTNASVLLWNRGDVVASVTVPRTSPMGLSTIAAAVDESLVEALATTCASTRVRVRDAGRSPWSVFPYTGNLVPRSIPLTYDDPDESPTPVVPTGATLVPVPGPTFPTPTLATAPAVAPVDDAPTPPVSTPWGSEGPVLAMTAAPSPPSVPPTPSPAAEVGELQPDPTGPGCGWAFAMQGTPSYDPDFAAERFAADVAMARQRLRDADARWQVDRVAYSIDYARYVAELRAFTTYANEYNAWVERSQGRAYDELLAEYEAAVRFRNTWDIDRAAAEQAYSDAIAACEAAGSPVATPTETATPEVPEEPEATPTSTELICPPERPLILDEPRPDLPPKPKPTR